MTTRYKSQQALAAQEIRKILKAKFPGTKFSVTSEGYSMGDNVNVRWTDGPLRNEVENEICQFQQGSFNGMEDIYEYDNSRDDIPQTNYLFCNRDRSPELQEKLAKEINAEYELNYTAGQYFRGESAPYNEDWRDWPSALGHRFAMKIEEGEIR